MKIEDGKKIFFASDHHLGAPNPKESLRRERHFVAWLEAIKNEAAALFILGDLFDFWFEYKTVVPKGFVRVLGKLAEITDAGIPVFFFVGNHDLWMRDYLEKELQIQVFRKPEKFTFNEKSFLIGHGDGLGPGDFGYKRMKKVFTNPFTNWLFRWLHPDIGVRLGQRLSKQNKLISGDRDQKFLGEENEWLIQYAKEKLKENHFDFFVFGHRHLPMTVALNDQSSYVNLGDWISYFSYAVFDGQELTLKNWKPSPTHD